MSLSQFYDKVYLGNPEKLREVYAITNVSAVNTYKKSELVFFDEYTTKLSVKELALAKMTLVIGKELTWLYSKNIEGAKPVKFFTTK